MTYYKEKKLLFGKSAQMAGTNRSDFMDFLAACRIDIHILHKAAIQEAILLVVSIALRQALLAEKKVTIFDLDENAARIETESAKNL